MPALIDYPDVVQEALPLYGPHFQNEPERRHFAEYLTGLVVAERKSVCGINREFAVTTDQSCLNRWLTQADWDVNAINDLRLAELQKRSETRYSARGVIAVDNTLVAHDGTLIEDVGWLWDHCEKRNVIAHDLLIANYVCSSGCHYPLEFRRFRKEDACEAAQKLIAEREAKGQPVSMEERQRAVFKSHTELFIELANWVDEHNIPGSYAFDSYFTNAEILNDLNKRERAYVGDLKSNRKVIYRGQEMSVSALAALIPEKDRKPIRIGDRIQYYFTMSLTVPKVDHRVRIVILWKNKEDKEAVKMLITNRTFWDVTRVLMVYRARWTGTETFHRDAKQQLGLGACQLQSGLGQTRHVYMVFLVYSLLTARMQQQRPSDWVKERLTTIGQACRAVLRETIGKTIDWVIQKVTTQHWNPSQIKEYLAVC